MTAGRPTARSCDALSLILPIGASLAAIALSACGGPVREAVRVDPPPSVVRDVPQPLKGTIGAEASFRGIDPALVSGLGIVVGLNGTGGADNLDQSVQATMERDAARNGIGRGSQSANIPGMENLTPSEFIRSKNVAVVIVEARVAPGAPEGSPFDVFVRTLPGSSVTSLEGGQLWTTDLRIGPAAVFGAIKTRRIAQASGPIFINPFSSSSLNAGGELQVTRTTGRILAGGKITDPLQIEMVLDNDSFARARSIVQAINSRFPRGSGDEGAVARGRGNGTGTAGYQSVALRVPYAYREHPDEFLQLVRHMRVDSAAPEEFSRQYTESLKSMPALAGDLSWCLQAMGKSSIPFVQQLYDYPELAPRIAALRTGARLGDHRAAAPLIELARKAMPSMRIEAIRLLGDMPTNSSINLALKDIVNDPNLEIRIAAYEAMRKRSDATILSIPIDDGGGGARTKFTLDLVPSNDPLIYITQQGEPRIVLFGGVDPHWTPSARANDYRGIRIQKPLLVSCWDDRFMMTAQSPTDEIRVMYRDPRTNAVTQSRSPEDLANFIEYLAQKPTPEDPKPGLAMSYSQVVGVVYALARTEDRGSIAAVSATFATEEDRLRAEIYEASQVTALADRPETEQDALKQADAVFKPERPQPLPSADPSVTPGDGTLKNKVVPLKKKTPAK